jgi:phosphonopyruvate decarboxylase
MGIPVDIIGPDDDVASVLRDVAFRSSAAAGPVAILVRKGTFTGDTQPTTSHGFTRLDVIRTSVAELPSNTAFVATTGYTGRELALVREERGESWRSDFLMVGSMGHASALALGIAKGSPGTLVCCLDGDGAVAMHMGSLASIGLEGPSNLIHVVLNNGVHESVGGQPSVLTRADLPALATSLGYTSATSSSHQDEYVEALRTAVAERRGPVLIEARIAQGTVDGLPRPSDFAKRADDFRAWLKHG